MNINKAINCDSQVHIRTMGCIGSRDLTLKAAGPRVFEPVDSGKGLPFLYVNADYLFENLIPQEVFIAESLGLGEIQMQYDFSVNFLNYCGVNNIRSRYVIRSMFGDYRHHGHVHYTLQASFRFKDPSLPTILLFQSQKHKADVEHPQYSDKGLYNLWYKEKVYSGFLVSHMVNTNDDGSVCHPQLEHGSPTFAHKVLETPLEVVNANPNPKFDELQRYFASMNAEFLDEQMKRKIQKIIQEANLPAVEKDLALISLYAALFSPDAKFEVSSLSKALAEKGVEALLSEIDALTLKVNAFQPQGTAKELPYLIEQLSELQDEADVVESVGAASLADQGRISALEAALAASAQREAQTQAKLDQIIAMLAAQKQ